MALTARAELAGGGAGPVTSDRLGRGAVWLVVAAALLFSSLVALRIYLDNDKDITAFVAFGVEDADTADYGRDRLGGVFLRDGPGHDGRFFFVQANDPFLVDPDDNAAVMDRPVYRSQRMLYPMIAGGAGLFEPEVIVWGLLVLNLAAMGLGASAVAEIATEMGGSPWWGLAFPLNIGLISEMSIDSAGVLAAAAAFGALALILKSRIALGVGLLVVAALSREAMLLMAAGAAFWLWRRGKRREAAYSAAIPGLAVLFWAIFVRIRLGDGTALSQVEEIGWPFVGVVEAFGSWLGDPIDLAVAVTLILLFVVFVRRVVIADALLGWATLGFVGLAVVFTEQVWRNYFDITRAVAPVITAFVLLVFLAGQRELSGPSQPEGLEAFVDGPSAT